MHPLRRRRLIIVGFVVVGAAMTVALVLTALKDNINLFYPPDAVVAGEAPVGARIRAGGMVLEGSIKRDTQSLRVEFIVTDYEAQVPVVYTGILPDLFDEGQGVVASGTLDANGVFQATEVLAKHDENYMPPEVQSALDQAAESGKKAETPSAY